jgi:hypothetical protein
LYLTGSKILNIRGYLPSDEIQLAEFANRIGAAHSQWKPVTPSGLLRRIRTKLYDPAGIFIAEENEALQGYIITQPDGRIHSPVCLPSTSEGLFTTAFERIRSIGKCPFFLIDSTHTETIRELSSLGFEAQFDLFNYIQRLTELPTMYLRRSMTIEPIQEKDLADCTEIAPSNWGWTVESIRNRYMNNHNFSQESIFLIRQGKQLAGIGILVDDRTFPVANQWEGWNSGIRAGSFGVDHLLAEPMTGMFSILIAPGKDAVSIGLDLLGHANELISDDQLEVIAAQVRSDSPELKSFYDRFFRHQNTLTLLKKPI